MTADAKTNWIEGYAMVSFYAMVVSEKKYKADFRDFPDCVCVPRYYALGSIPVNLRSH